MKSILFLLLIPVCFFSQMNSLKLYSIKTTMLEKGVEKSNYNVNTENNYYKKLKYSYNPTLGIFIIKHNHKCDTIIFGQKTKIYGITNDEDSILYPTDVVDDCFAKNGKSCIISQSLLDIIGEKKPDKLKFSLGKIKGDAEDKKYVLYYLSNNKYALLINNDFLILTFTTVKSR